LIALAAAALIGVAAPAMASPFGDGSTEMRELQANLVLHKLQDKGINATGVEEWGSLVRAYVVSDSGKLTMEYFQPETLIQVTR
jgi:hypothetical protein